MTIPRPIFLPLTLALLASVPSALLAQDFQPPWPSDRTPPLIRFDGFNYGSTGHDIAEILGYRLPGRAPIVISIPSHDALSEESRLETDWLPSFLFDHGFAMARVRKRSQRDISGLDFVTAMANAVATIVGRANQTGFDGSRLILMGKGWGGQVAMLLATSPHFLEQAGVDFNSVRGAIILDGWGFDLPSYYESTSDFRKKQISRLLAAEDGSAATLSSARFVGPPNARRFLFYAIATDDVSVGQAEAMSAALREAGSPSEVRTVSETKWRSPATYPGSPRSPENEKLLEFLKSASE